MRSKIVPKFFNVALFDIVNLGLIYYFMIQRYLYKIIMELLLLFLIFFFTVSCNLDGNRNKNGEVIRIDKSDDLYQWSKNSVRVTKYVVLKDDGVNLIGYVSKLVYNDNRYFILDFTQNKIFVYNDSGDFLNVIGSRGRGPGEYLELRDFQVHKGRVYILDNNLIRIYSYEGSFIDKLDLVGLRSDMKVSPTQFGITLNSDFIFWTGNFGPARESEVLYITNSKLEILNKYFPFNGNYADAYHFTSANNDYLFSGVNGDYNLYMIKDKKIILEYSIDFGKEILQFEKSTDKQTLYNSIAQNSLVHSLREIYYTSEYVSFIYQKGNTPYMGFFNRKTKTVRTDNCIKPVIFGGAMIRGTHDKEFILSYPIDVVNNKDFFEFTKIRIPGEINNPIIVHVVFP